MQFRNLLKSTFHSVHESHLCKNNSFPNIEKYKQSSLLLDVAHSYRIHKKEIQLRQNV
jgi:hypothetical protein